MDTAPFTREKNLSYISHLHENDSFWIGNCALSIDRLNKFFNVVCNSVQCNVMCCKSKLDQLKNCSLDRLLHDCIS